MKQRVHVLKSHPHSFVMIAKGEKKHDVRLADRDYQVGDFVRLCEWDPVLKTAIGNTVHRRISYIDSGTGVSGVMSGYCVLSLAASSPGQVIEIIEPKAKAGSEA